MSFSDYLAKTIEKQKGPCPLCGELLHPGWEDNPYCPQCRTTVCLKAHSLKRREEYANKHPFRYCLGILVIVVLLLGIPLYLIKVIFF